MLEHLREIERCMSTLPMRLFLIVVAIVTIILCCGCSSSPLGPDSESAASKHLNRTRGYQFGTTGNGAKK
jgi:hypothetical protein